jgi:molybdenum storage protein
VLVNTRAVLPDTRVVKIGGQSIIDRGGAALLSVLAAVAAARSEGVDVLVTCGGGTRARHIYALASDLRLPTGILSALGARVPIQNARIVQTVLASAGGVFVEPDEVQRLPELFRSGCIPIMGGMAPFAYWEMREEGSRIPPHRTDTGTWLLAEYLGSPRCLFIKDENGLYTDDPKRNPKACWITAATAEGAASLPDVVVERVLLDYLPRARFCRQVQIVNGLLEGVAYRALMGEPVGSIIGGG